jgi:hypothetical protein
MRLHGLLASALVFLAAFNAQGAEPDPNGVPSIPAKRPDVRPLPVVRPISPGEKEGVNWKRLSESSLRFLGVMQAFRLATEQGTRAGGFGLGSTYVRSVENLHGWADGDPFYVNYVGHPMQGAVSGNLFLLNDPQFNHVEFGSSPQYWKGKLRAGAFAWAFSEQFEIGILSEASIGHIQAEFPQQGFVDHVVTPVVGMSWMVAEDAVDRYIIKRLEGITRNKWARIALRTGLNPTRSFANLMDARAPWRRETRAGVLDYEPEKGGERDFGSSYPEVFPAIAPFEFSINTGYRVLGGHPCMGGGAEAALRAAAPLQLVLDVNGCKLLGLGAYDSGDGLFYQAGPRWTPMPAARWSPFAQLLVGGMKITREQLDPVKKAAVEAVNEALDPSLGFTLHDQYTRHEEASGFAISAGAGVDCKLSPALALRVANVEYLHSNLRNVDDSNYSHGWQVTSGIVLRLGTW